VARKATLRRFRARDGVGAIDSGLALWFPGPGTFTGEDSCEFHVHGGNAVAAAMLDAIGAIDGTRIAEAGEFTRRAFENGRIDLTAAEGLGDLIAADTEAQRRQAVAIAGGALARRLERWRSKILRARAAIEADFDFADEDDIPSGQVSAGFLVAGELAGEIRKTLEDGNRGEIVRTGFQVVVAGKPNAGKSSLVNALAGRELAIVAPDAGTTRDIVEARLDIGGYAVIVADTAGIRSPTGAVEREGIRRARERAGMADLVIWLDEEGREPQGGELPAGGASIWVLRSKDDTGRFGSESISTVSGHGLDALSARLLHTLRDRLGRSGEILVTHARHRAALEECAGLLEQASAAGEEAEEVRAEFLRAASDALGRLTGAIGSEEVLGEVFRRFCIGK
jgi:tRNA modification GTPase